MKHLASPHPWFTTQQPADTGASLVRDAAWRAAAALGRLVAVQPRRHGRHAAAPMADVAPAGDASAVAPAASAPASAAQSRWARHELRSGSWVEGLILVSMIAFFGAGLVAILGGF